MKTLFTYLLMFLTIIFLSCSQKESDKSENIENNVIQKTDTVETVENSLTRNNIKGKVKTLTEYSYKVIEKFGELQEGDYLGKTITRYDEKGFATEEDNFAPNDKLIYKEKPRFDSLGKWIESNKFDSKGNLVHKTIPKYNENGLRIERTIYDEKGDLDSKSLFKYDDNENMVDEREYDKNGNLFEITSYNKYNNDGELISWTIYNSDGNVKYSMTVECVNYDDEGNWLKIIYYNNKIATNIDKREIEYYK